jgi:hypothetical protein
MKPHQMKALQGHVPNDPFSGGFNHGPVPSGMMAEVPVEGIYIAMTQLLQQGDVVIAMEPAAWV